MNAVVWVFVPVCEWMDECALSSSPLFHLGMNIFYC